MDFLYKRILILSLLVMSFSLQAVCITNKTRIDIECNCRKKNSCLKYNSKNLKKQMSNATIVSGKKVKKVYNKVMPAYKGADTLFNGTADYKKIDVKKFKKVDQQFKKLNTRLIKNLEKKYKASGSKHHSFSKLQKYIGKVVNKAIPQKVRNYVERNGLSVGAISKAYGVKSKNLGSNFGSSADSSVQAIASIAKGNPIANEDDLSEDTTNMTKEEKARLEAARAAQNMRSNKKYKFNDIHPNHKDIWRVISVRYSSVQGRLDQRAIIADGLKIDKRGVKRQFFNLIDKM